MNSMASAVAFCTVSGINMLRKRSQFRVEAFDKPKRKEVMVADGEELRVLYDDGYGSSTVKDYLYAAKDIIKPDGGPPRWFCPVECGQPVKNSPTLLFLPGLDGVGFGLILHHKAFGKAFEVRCLHIPVNDRTPFEELVKIIDRNVKAEHASSPNKPIYLLGDSFGGCLALAVAARNRDIDLVVILVNPATSYHRSQLQTLLPVLESLPDDLHFTLPYLLSLVMGDPLKMASVSMETRLPPAAVLRELFSSLTDLLPCLKIMADILPKETLLWKLKLLGRAAAYANSRLHAVDAQVLIVASGKDNVLPSAEEAKRLKNLLKNCRVRTFNDNGHAILLEDGVNLMTVIKATHVYRRNQSRVHDFDKDFLPPSKQEFRHAREVLGIFRNAASSVLLSTMENGKIVRGLAGVPNKGPVLLIGYHSLIAMDLASLLEHFLEEKNIMVRTLAHPLYTYEFDKVEFQILDMAKLFGVVPVGASNLYRLFSKEAHVLLFPGGVREALHLKGEEYKLCWPEQAEFVRMAARFGATIVPFATVGEDDLTEYVLDYDDLLKIPILNDYVRGLNRDAVEVRDKSSGRVANDALPIPGLLPKIPGRLYYLFGKPIETKGSKDILRDKEAASALYSQVKTEVENQMAYLLRKREEDPFRCSIDRTVYRALYADPDTVPTFEL